MLETADFETGTTAEQLIQAIIDRKGPPENIIKTGQITMLYYDHSDNETRIMIDEQFRQVSWLEKDQPRDAHELGSILMDDLNYNFKGDPEEVSKARQECKEMTDEMLIEAKDDFFCRSEHATKVGPSKTATLLMEDLGAIKLAVHWTHLHRLKNDQDTDFVNCILNDMDEEIRAMKELLNKE